MSNLKHYIWSALNKFGVEVLAFVGNVLLARVLSPGDFGLIAMLAIFSAISYVSLTLFEIYSFTIYFFVINFVIP